jgi:hypothetical protein
MYSPAIGRFTTKDSWLGDRSRPLSLNRWVYGYGNPINLIDPSGLKPRPPHSHFSCQMMPTKAFYELCILRQYGLEPISYFELGQTVQGAQGCYSGPIEYRAPGYIEGYQFGVAIPVFTSLTWGHESVYDFATMEQHDFDVGMTDWTDIGIVLSDLGVGISAAEYAGNVKGLKSSLSLREAYKGGVIQITKGLGIGIVGAELGLGAGAGKSSFVSTSDWMVRGTTWYIGLNGGADVLPIVDVGISLHLNYVPSSKPGESYLMGDKHVDETRLYTDILFGRHNVWPVRSDPLHGDIPMDWASRSLGMLMAMKYVRAYEELHFDESK